jgi:hypothetical protein
MEIYERVLSTMPQMFSTNQYLVRLKRVATSQDDVSGGKHIKFIKNECHRVSNRTYMKRPKPVQLELEQQVVEQPVLNEHNATELLKSLGYKVLKPIKDWVEI